MDVIQDEMDGLINSESDPKTIKILRYIGNIIFITLISLFSYELLNFYRTFQQIAVSETCQEFTEK